VSIRSYSILASVIGSALGAWWWSHRQRAARPTRDRGTVIFDNTPTATPLSGEGII
jgi:hypothetical protein